MRLRHKEHKSSRHLHAPYHQGPGRKRGGRVHPGLKAEGEKSGERHDRSHRRSKGGSTDGHWMEKAFANAHGQFKAKAKKAGMSTEAFAKKEKGSSKATTKTKRQANLAMLGHKFGGHHH